MQVVLERSPGRNGQSEREAVRRVGVRRMHRAQSVAQKLVFQPTVTPWGSTPTEIADIRECA